MKLVTPACNRICSFGNQHHALPNGRPFDLFQCQGSSLSCLHHLHWHSLCMYALNNNWLEFAMASVKTALKPRKIIFHYPKESGPNNRVSLGTIVPLITVPLITVPTPGTDHVASISSFKKVKPYQERHNKEKIPAQAFHTTSPTPFLRATN